VLRKNNVSRCSFERVRRNPCAKSMRLTSQNKAYVERVVSSINKADACFRRDQRAFLLHFTGRCFAKSPHDRNRFPFRKKARSSRAAFLCRMIGGLSASGSATVVSLRAPFPPSLRLRFTFPFAEPLAETFTCLSPISCHLIYRLANFPHVAGIYPIPPAIQSSFPA